MDNNVSANNFTHVLTVDNFGKARPLQTAVGREPYLPTSDIGNATILGSCQSSDRRRLENRNFAHWQAQATSTFGDHNTPPPFNSSEDESSFTIKKCFLNNPETMVLLREVGAQISTFLPDDIIHFSHYPKFQKVEPSERAKLFREHLQDSHNVNAISIVLKHGRMKNCVIRLLFLFHLYQVHPYRLHTSCENH